jgi:hypothetical protein
MITGPLMARKNLVKCRRGIVVAHIAMPVDTDFRDPMIDFL